MSRGLRICRLYVSPRRHTQNTPDTLFLPVYPVNQSAYFLPIALIRPNRHVTPKPMRGDRKQSTVIRAQRGDPNPHVGTSKLHSQFGGTAITGLRDVVQLRPITAWHFTMTERILVRGNLPCGIHFCLHGPRSVKYTSIWETDRNTLLFYNPTGERFHRTQLTEAPQLTATG